MAVVLSLLPNLPNLPSIYLRRSQSNRSRPSLLLRASSPSCSRASMDSPGSKLMEFPYATAPVRSLMVDLVSTVESRLNADLLPCTLPPDVQHYQNADGSAVSSLYVRPGAPSSPIDVILASWLHHKLPTGASLDINSLLCYLNDSTDAPHFLIEIIQMSDTSMGFFLDVVPRKDLVLHPDYLKTFYEETQLEKQRQLIGAIPEEQPYFTTALYFRPAMSPTAILASIETKDGADPGSRLDEIVQRSLHPVAKEVLKVWFDGFLDGKREVTAEERRQLKERDRMFKSKAFEIDLSSTLPSIFGQEKAERVMGVLKDVLNI